LQAADVLFSALTQRFSNCAEYNLEDVVVEHLIAAFVETDHFLVYTQTFEEDGVYIIAPPSLRENPAAISRILMEAFHINESEEEANILENKDEENEPIEFVDYLLILSPRTQFLWNGLVLMFEIPKFDLDLKDNRIRLVADGTQGRLAMAKREFAEIFMPMNEDGVLLEVPLGPLTCITEQQSHLPNVNNELRKIARATNRLAQSIVDSVHHVRAALKEVRGCQELLENWYFFASEHGQHVQKYMDTPTLVKFNQMLNQLAISWVSFICDDCDPDDQMTFKWAVNALEFTLHRTKRNNILQIPDDQFEMLRQKVASCMTLLISHFDILGARSTQEANKERERQQEIHQHQASSARMDEEDNNFFDTSSEDTSVTFIDPAVRMFWEKTSTAVKGLEVQRTEVVAKNTVGRVLDEEKLVDRSLVSLAGSSSNISIRWQQGRFIGAGSFGSVYLAVNLDTGSLMAVKEIKYTEVAGLPNLYSQIKDELRVMEMLHHPNVVEYYGIEVHRDKVYIFEEYCQGGSLASLLEHGRIEDEGLIQVYTMQMLEGLAYLHSQGVVHRDVKPDSKEVIRKLFCLLTKFSKDILLDHMGVIKFVDFGAAKILAKNQRSIQRSRRLSDSISPIGPLVGGLGGLGVNNSLTGTPMYMSPEIIRNNKRGRHGAMDIWSMGCVALECATGKKPWSNLDNEWYIFYV
jgi:mitogen-activated protein kinase kinase kinase